MACHAGVDENSNITCNITLFLPSTGGSRDTLAFQPFRCHQGKIRQIYATIVVQIKGSKLTVIRIHANPCIGHGISIHRCDLCGCQRITVHPDFTDSSINRITSSTCIIAADLNRSGRKRSCRQISYAGRISSILITIGIYPNRCIRRIIGDRQHVPLAIFDVRGTVTICSLPRAFDNEC